MALFETRFYDKYGNFDNSKFIELLKKSQKQQLKAQLGRKTWAKDIILFASVARKDLWQFINKFSIFVNSGIDVKWALGILVKQTKNPLLKKIIIEMKENIDHGVSIHETMLMHPKIFDPLTTALIEVGEKTGQLGKILAELDTSLLDSIELKWKVKGAMIYPMILLGLTISMVIFMMIFIVPKITASFEKTGSALPAMTQIVVNISNFFLNDWGILIIVSIATIVFLKMVGKTYTGKVIFANIFIRLPVFGYIVKQSNIIYFIKSFTILIDAWVLLLEALKTSSKVVPNLMYKKELIRIKNEVEAGLTISKSLWLNLDYETNVYINKLFSEEFAYVVSTGEETWSLSGSLKKIGYNYDAELKRYIGNLSSMMEPIIIVIVWFLVGSIVVAIMLPFFSLGKVAKKL